MVEKRAIAFLMLASIVWAALASTFAGYYFLQSENNAEQLNSAQNSLNRVASSYSDATKRYNLLLSEYASLYGNYTYFHESNYAPLMSPLGNAIADLGKNYADLFRQNDMNKTYDQLQSDYETLLRKDNVTREDFGNLLSEYYNLFNLSALRDLTLSVSQATTLSVNIEIDYGNETTEWHNETQVSAGYTLFGLTEEIAVIKYSYYSFSVPGHVLVDSINNKTQYTDPSYTWGYTWIWRYWNSNDREWVSGPVGCDAWMLENGGTYQWIYERWSYP